MKIFTSFTEKKRTGSAILISTFVEETGKEETFFLPLSVAEIQNNQISIDDDFWTTKLEELKNPQVEKEITFKTNIYEKGEKSTKIAVYSTLKSFDKVNEIWLFLPNSKITEMKVKKNDDFENTYEVTVPDWVYQSSLKSALKYQLDNFWNKDKEVDQHYGIEDFNIQNNLL